jgi:hypothetical protein
MTPQKFGLETSTLQRVLVGAAAEEEGGVWGPSTAKSSGEWLVCDNRFGPSFAFALSKTSQLAPTESIRIRTSHGPPLGWQRKTQAGSPRQGNAALTARITCQILRVV